MPLLIEYKDDESHFCYVLMMSDIASSADFQGKLMRGQYYDCETPYGYGGPLYDKPITATSQRKFILEMRDWAKENSVISQFIRFHPLLMNHENTGFIFETRYLHDTIYIDTESPEVILHNMDSKNRNMLRKAQKSGVTIIRRDIGCYKDFLPIYIETMKKDNADSYYYFSEKYFKYLNELTNNVCIFFAIKDEKSIAASIMYYNDKFIHYHLAGTLTEFRKYAPSNLLLYETACWASKKGIKKFHLGGGMLQDDNLFRFKKQFNKQGRLPFVIGKTVFDEDAYNMLLRLRKEINPNFNVENNRMIQYRA